MGLLFNPRARGKLRGPLVIAWHDQNCKTLCAMWHRPTPISSHLADFTLPSTTLIPFNYFNALDSYTLRLLSSAINLFPKYYVLVFRPLKTIGLT